jgi:hypothetical protein
VSTGDAPRLRPVVRGTRADRPRPPGRGGGLRVRADRRERHVEAIQAYVDAGFDHVYVHQVGPDREGFLEAYARDVLPRFSEPSRAARGAA